MVENFDYFISLLLLLLLIGENLFEGDVDLEPDFDPDLDELPGDIILTNFINLSPIIFLIID